MAESKELQRLQDDKSQQTPIICKSLDQSRKCKPLGETKKAVFRQKLMVLLGNTGVLGGGMAMALPTVSLDQLTDTKQQFFLLPEEASWFSSMNNFACPLAGLIIGYLIDRIGRKNMMLCTNVVGIMSWALLVTAPFQSDRDTIYAQMLIARFLSGILTGLSLSPMTVYSAEISLPKIRGRLMLGTTLGFACGILLMYLLGYFIRNDWQLIAVISGCYQVFSALCVLPLPESPSWLMQKGRTEQARQSLKYFRGLHKNATDNAEFETEWAQIRKTAEESRSSAASESLLQAVRSPEVYKPLLLLTGLFVFQQFSGVIVIVVYAVQIAATAGAAFDPSLCAVLVGVARILTTCCMGSLFERWGRRRSGMISAIGMSVCMLLLAACGWFPALGEHLAMLPPLCIVLHIVFSTMGLLTLPFFMMSEVFPQRSRGSASGLTLFMGSSLSFVVIKLFPSMTETMGSHNVFAFYGCVSLVGVAYIYCYLPETRGRTLLQIEEYFRTGRKVERAKKLQHDTNLRDEETGQILIQR